MTKPEEEVKELLEELGFTVKPYAESSSDDCIYMQMPFSSYHIDFAYPKKKIALEVDGDYWHGLRDQVLTATQVKTKIKDAAKQLSLVEAGWRVFHIPVSTLQRREIAKRRLNIFFTEEWNQL